MAKTKKLKKETAVAEEMNSDDILQQLEDTINKAYGEPVLIRANKVKLLEKIPTGIFTLDLELEGGMPRGRGVILVGDESSFKSTILYKSMGNFQRICGNCLEGKIKEVSFKKIVVEAVKGKQSLHNLCNPKKENLFCKGEKFLETKTLKCYEYELECDVCNSPQYSIAFLIDAENNYTREWATKFGLVPHYLGIAKSKYSEQVGDILREVMNKGRITSIGIDSLDASPPNAENTSSVEDQTMGLQARIWNKITRIVHSRLNKFFTYSYTKLDKTKVTEVKQPNPTVFIIQQWREKIGAYGDPRTTGGGLGKRYLASLTIGTSRGEKDWRSKEDKDLRGEYINFNFIKQKTGTPMRYNRFYFSLDSLSVVNEISIIDVAIENGYIEQGGAWFHFEGKKFQGYDKLVEHLRKDKKTIEKLKQKMLSDRKKLKDGNSQEQAD